MEKRLKLILPMLATASILFIIYAINGLYPFGDMSISWGDMNQQVIPLLDEFRDMLLGKQDFLFSMQNAGGMNFWGVFLFFIASPFSFLTVFVEKADMFLFMNLLVLLKMMTCAGTAAVFFSKIYPKLELGFCTALSVSYAFCGYVMLFYQNVVWLDMMYLFPLLLLSLNYLAKTGRFLPYLLCLSGMITVHFYLSYMLLAFLVLCSCLWVFFSIKEPVCGQRVVSLGLGTMGAGLLTAVVWLPSLIEYLGSARGANLFDSLAAGNFLTRMDTIGMLLLCTAYLLPVFLYRICRTALGMERGIHQKVILLSFLFLIIPMVVEPINKMWHTGSYQAFPGRYGYITIFLGLILAADTLVNRRVQETGRSHKWAVFAGFSFLALALGASITLLIKHKRELTVYITTLWGTSQSLSLFLMFSALLVAGYFACYLMYRNRALTRRMFCIFFCLLVCVESVFYVLVFFPQRGDYNYRSVMDLEDRIDDDSFYRVKNLEKSYDLNLTGAIGYPTMNHYTSLTSKYYMSGIKKLGYSSYWMEVSSIGGTKFSDALMQNRYSITWAGAVEEGEQIYANDKYQILQNSGTLPLGLLTQADLSTWEELPMIQRPYINEQVLQVLFGTQEALVQEYLPTYTSGVELSHDENYRLERTVAPKDPAVIEYLLPATERPRTVYFDCFGSVSNALTQPYYSAFDISVNGVTVMQNYPTQRSNGLLTLAQDTTEELLVSIRVKKDVEVSSFGVFSMDDRKVSQILSGARTANLTVKDGTITGTANAEQGDTLFLSIPYDRGFTVEVNGEKQEYTRVFDAFIAVGLDAGENEIAITYLPPGMRTGAMLSVCGAVLTAAVIVLQRRGKLELSKLEKPAVIILSVLGGAVFALLYLMPVVVYIFGRIS